MNITQIAQNLSNVNTLQEILATANQTTNDTFWTGIFWMILVIILVSSLAFGFEAAVLLTFFAGFVFGLFLLYLGLIGMFTFGITVGALFFFALYLIYTSNRNQ